MLLRLGLHNVLGVEAVVVESVVVVV